MIKKSYGLFILCFLVLFSPMSTFASGLSREYNPPSNSDYFKKKISAQLYISHGVEKLRMTQFTYGPPKEVIEVVTWNVKGNSYIWVDMTCKGDTLFEYLDSDGDVVDYHTRGQSSIKLAAGSCKAGETIKLSDFNEEENQYASDTFGGTKPKLDKPSSPDGSGGDGESGFEGEDDGSDNDDDSGSDDGDDDGSGDDGTGDDGSDDGDNDDGNDDDDSGDDGKGEDEYDYPEWCDPECRIFECPQWDEYMGTVEDILDAIPPPPNWPKVADTFRDSIVPEMISELDDLLGRAPTPPSPPPALPAIDDRGLSDNVPSMPDLPDIPQFDADDIKSQAPTIPENPDPTGGFDLLDNPLDTLPDAPENPIPGQTDPGAWGENQPAEQDNPFPYPEDQGNPDIGDPPIPGDNGATPPMPGGDAGSAPIPGGDYGEPPTTGGELPGMIDYKPSPDSPDGSGGDIYP